MCHEIAQSGESEKLVRTMFALAKHHQPSVIFIDGELRASGLQSTAP